MEQQVAAVRNMCGGSARHVCTSNAKAMRAMVEMYRVSRAAQSLSEEEQAQLMQKDMATFLEGARRSGLERSAGHRAARRPPRSLS